MYTDDVTLILYSCDPPEGYKEELRTAGIPLIKGSPMKIIGEKSIEAVEMKDGARLLCAVIVSNFGYKLNDDFLAGLSLKKDAEGFKYVTNHNYESTLSGLYIVGPRSILATTRSLSRREKALWRLSTSNRDCLLCKERQNRPAVRTSSRKKTDY